MAEFLGSRISLISKSDIRYVGILNEINSTASTVSLENVTSYGTEGRKAHESEEIPATDQVYEYIVFRGSDVKDLRIEHHPGVKENKPQAIPDDPAIVGARPLPGGAHLAAMSHLAQPPPQPLSALPSGPGTHFAQPPYGPFYGVPPAPWGRPSHVSGPVPPGFPGMPYPPGPGWYPPGLPGHGFHNPHNPNYNYEYPPPAGLAVGSVNAQSQQINRSVPGRPLGAVVGTEPKSMASGSAERLQGPIVAMAPSAPTAPTAPTALAAPVNPAPTTSISPPLSTPSKSTMTSPAPAIQATPAATTSSIPASLLNTALATATQTQPSGAGNKARHSMASSPAPPPPVGSKPTVEQVNAIAAGHYNRALQSQGASKSTRPMESRNNRFTPIIPLQSTVGKQASQTEPNGRTDTTSTAREMPPGAGGNLKDATEAARAAVAVAMSKLPSLTAAQARPTMTPSTSGPANSSAVDNLTSKVNEMRLNAARTGQNGRTRGRAPRPTQAGETASLDFDFQSSNARFNKKAIVQEAQAVQDGGGDSHWADAQLKAAESATDKSATAYNRTTSFFDNIGSEAKDRAENSGHRPGGRLWRTEEQKKNQETFGAASVDEGRTYGRGRGFRGRRYGGGGGGGVGGRGGRGGNYHGNNRNGPPVAVGD